MGYENLMQMADRIKAKAYDRAIVEVMGPTRESREERQGRLHRIQSSADGVHAAFQPFTQLPDPAAFNGPIEQLKISLGILSAGEDTTDPLSRNGRVYPANLTMSKIRSVDSDVQGWSGVAAQEFRTKFLIPLPAVTHNQFLLVSALKSALEAEQAMWKAAREDIAQIADNTYNYLDSMGDCSKNDAVCVLTVVASICAVVTAPWGGAALPIVITAIGAVASAGADVVGLEPAPKTEISGERVPAVMDSMYRAVRLLMDKIVETETRIRTSVSNLSNQIHGAQSSSNPDQHAFCARRPSLADARKGSIKHDMGYTD